MVAENSDINYVKSLLRKGHNETVTSWDRQDLRPCTFRLLDNTKWGRIDFPHSINANVRSDSSAKLEERKRGCS